MFVSPIKAADDTVLGIAIDFATTNGRDLEDALELEVSVQGDELHVDGEGRSLFCAALPESLRLTLFAEDGQLDATSRVRVVARRADGNGASGTDGTDSGSSGESSAEGGAAGAAADGQTEMLVGCRGPVLDDAVWPSGAARPPSPDAGTDADGGMTDAGMTDAGTTETGGAGAGGDDNGAGGGEGAGGSAGGTSSAGGASMGGTGGEGS